MIYTEKILRVCCLGPEGVDIPINVGPEPSRCRWIVVTCVPDGPPADPVTYIVYFLDLNGVEIDFAQRDSLQEATDTGKILSHHPDLQWIECELDLSEDEDFDILELQRICDDDRSNLL